MTEYLKCTDCVHARCGGTINTFVARLVRTQYGWQCNRVQVPGEFNRATGTQEPDQYQMCAVERGKYGECGETAQHWTPLYRKDLFKLLARP